MDEAKKQSPTSKALEGLSMSCRVLEEAIDELVERLGLVLRGTEDIMPSAKTKEKDVNASRLRASIEEVSDRLKLLTGRLETVKKDLDVLTFVKLSDKGRHRNNHNAKGGSHVSVQSKCKTEETIKYKGTSGSACRVQRRRYEGVPDSCNKADGNCSRR